MKKAKYMDVKPPRHTVSQRPRVAHGLLSIGEFPVVVIVYPDHIEQMKTKGRQ
jgi:hypothetical protein